MAVTKIYSTVKEVTKFMEKNILETFQPNIMERLGGAYSRNGSYKAALEKEKALAGRLRETLTEE